jgi:hypothetical protein
VTRANLDEWVAYGIRVQVQSHYVWYKGAGTVTLRMV